MSKIYSIMNSGSVFGLFLQVIPITLLAGIVYAALRCVYVKRHNVSVRLGTESARLLFMLYLTGLVNLVLVPADFWIYVWANVFVGDSHREFAFFSGDFNLVPTVFGVLAGKITLGSWTRTMLVYNLLMFVPLGFFLPLVSEKINNRSVLKIAIFVPIAVELIQPVIGRSFDTDDLILNFAGIILGYFIARLFAAVIGKLKK